jgi:hypothetical protein
LQVETFHVVTVAGFNDQLRAIVETPANRDAIASHLGSDPIEYINFFVRPLIEQEFFRVLPQAPLRTGARRIAALYGVSEYDAQLFWLSLTRTAPLVVAEERLRPVLKRIQDEVASISADYPGPRPKFDVWWIEEYPW